MSFHLTIALSLSMLFAVVGCSEGGGNSEAGSTEAPTPAGAESPVTLDTLAILLDPGHTEWSRQSPPLWRARFETSKGDFDVEVRREAAPLGSDRFYNLVRLGYYNDTRFHRVREEYIAQFGLHGNPEVNRAWLDRQLPDDPPGGTNVRGTLAFAMSLEPNTRNTQIYINLADNTRNDAEPFSVFGSVVEGMEVVDRLFAGYGEESGSGVRHGLQGPIIEGGNAYLDEEFPQLDQIHRALLLEGNAHP
ncbi:MAG: peptidylprolyl isomerase [Gemmatimonadota bacterium]